MHKENQYNTNRNSKLTNKEKGEEKMKNVTQVLFLQQRFRQRHWSAAGVPEIKLLLLHRQRGRRHAECCGNGGNFRGDYILAFLYPGAEAGNHPEGRG